MTHTPKNSEQECQTMRKDIANLTSHLEDLLQANKTCNGWDEAGSLEHVKHLLKQVVAFYGGLSETEIEETLTELRD